MGSSEVSSNSSQHGSSDMLPKCMCVIIYIYIYTHHIYDIMWSVVDVVLNKIENSKKGKRIGFKALRWENDEEEIEINGCGCSSTIRSHRSAITIPRIRPFATSPCPTFRRIEAKDVVLSCHLQSRLRINKIMPYYKLWSLLSGTTCVHTCTHSPHWITTKENPPII